MTSRTITIGDDGALVIPAAFLDEIGVATGDSVVLQRVDGELRVVPLATAVRRAQDLARPFLPEGGSVVDEFIADRRAEAARE
jgi:antitoxin component of MazEF toxin-antitoxin module